MYIGRVEWDKIQVLRESYLNGLPDGETRSAHLDMNSLRGFLKHVIKYARSSKNPINDVDIVFLRGGITKPDDWYSELEDGKLQMNLALVVKVGNEAFVLEPGGESTGLCPKNCGTI